MPVYQARFGATQSNLGVQFFGSTGTLLASRITAGITSLPETGSYVVTLTPPTGAAGIYWNDTVTLATAIEDLRDVNTIERLNLLPDDAPVVIIPDPSDDSSLCVVYCYTESLANAVRAGVVIRISLSGNPSKSNKVLESDSATMTTDANGFASVAIQRTDTMTPAGRYYLVNCADLGFVNKRMELAATTYDLASLIS
jgi:hypothetical protein